MSDGDPSEETPPLERNSRSQTPTPDSKIDSKPSPSIIHLSEENDQDHRRVTNFKLTVDSHNNSLQIKILHFSRPHMRAFHLAWLSFFLAFFGWFAIPPLMSTIKQNPNLGLEEKSARINSNIIAVSGTILMRMLIGPLCDRFGPRRTQSALLTVFSLPVFLVATAFNYASFCTARFFIGFIGAAFVVTQFWCSIMFALPVVGAANAIVAGWGNLGGGATNVLMPQIFKAIKSSGVSNDTAWRLCMIFPGCLLILSGIAVYIWTDDCPDGDYQDLIAAGTKTKANPVMVMSRAARNWRVWILHVLYACCFGVELVMNGNLSDYFQEKFDLSQSTAGLIAGLFGLMNLFARALGGISSDLCSKRYGMRGRLWSFFSFMFLEGIMIIVFSRMNQLPEAIVVLIFFSLFVQMSEGAIFGVVPYVDPAATGAVSGIVGAGGNVGAILLSLLLKMNNSDTAFLVLGCVVLGSSLLVCTLYWPQYGSMFCKAEPEEAVSPEAQKQYDENPPEGSVTCW